MHTSTLISRVYTLANIYICHDHIHDIVRTIKYIHVHIMQESHYMHNYDAYNYYI